MTTPPVTQPLSSHDRQIIQELKDKAWFSLLKLYIPLFLGLVYVYYDLLPRYREHPVKFQEMSRRDYAHVYEVFAAVFGTIFLIFLVKDFRRLILPFGRELKTNQKVCRHFPARKYADPIFKKSLIFYPGKEDVYIELEENEFNAIQDGQPLYLETGLVTGEIFLLRSETREFNSADEFSFSD